MVKTYIDGVELSKIPVIQNEKGVYYFSPEINKYYKPLLKDFDTAKPPKGYYKYGAGIFQKKPAGSHASANYSGVNIKEQLAIDFSAIALGKSKLTYNRVVEVMGVYGSGVQKYMVVGFGDKKKGVYRYQDTIVHVKTNRKVGEKIKAKEPVCTVYFDHFHMFTKRYGKPYPIRERVLG